MYFPPDEFLNDHLYQRYGFWFSNGKYLRSVSAVHVKPLTSVSNAQSDDSPVLDPYREISRGAYAVPPCFGGIRLKLVTTGIDPSMNRY